MSMEPRPNRSALRSVAAVLAGLVVIVVLSIGTDMALHATGVYPPLGEPMNDTFLLLLATAYRSAYAVAGSYLAARIATDRPMGHALALGVVGLALGIAGAVSTRDAGPAWYPIALIVIAMPCAWAGGRLHGVRAPKSIALE